MPRRASRWPAWGPSSARSGDAVSALGVVVAGAILATGLLLVPRRWSRPGVKATFAALAAVACLAGPVGYSLDTIASAQGDNITIEHWDWRYYAE